MATVRRLADFGTRSLVTHALMALSLLGAVGSAFLLEGNLQVISFVAFLNFTAGLWIAQSIHSLGNSYTDDDYEGILKHLGQ